MNALALSSHEVSASAQSAVPVTPLEQLRLARQVLSTEAAALSNLAARLDGSFCRAVELLQACGGSLIVCGMGKAGLIGQKLVATFASTGTRSHFLHPAEAVHGDLGRVHRDDVLLMLSYSGETEEVTRLLPTFNVFGVPMIALTGNPKSQLARAASVVLDLGPLEEACPHGLAPSTSTTAMLALGDALALVMSRLREFSPEDFARFHPAGSLGRKLARVEEAMRPLSECRVARHSHTVREVLVEVSRPGRRSGAVLLTDDFGRLAGIFTDSDLARLFENRRDALLDGPVSQVMTAAPRSVALGAKLSDAVAMLAAHKISELPVVDGQNRPIGLIDITDVVGLLPREETQEEQVA